ncbi:hypothetical protein B7C51_15655 [Paenibacillus larvae subsp. pulvifaciens]|uniref:Nucleoside 2-deoxyribosyltransferase n=1 Tax=Paenibacillus larvae subsp. pulvifaciens TaxID=1477 RepID=A0A1V0UUK9_9BACL|nr:hypothetical protein [Paenibacillus larvae]ARF68925.1 hypothetical protein B7C51_15655 [Paenibacillus larvae subsp. pulvifaciens]
MKTCFVVSPIGSDGSETRRRSDQVLKHIITPVCEQNDYEVVRVDRISDSDSIDQTIIKYLKESELVITDLTDHNPNVFFESGYRLAFDKPMIQLILEGQQLPFDVSTTRTINYKLDDPDKIEGTKQKLNETISTVTINNESKSEGLEQGQNSQVTQKIFSLLFDIKDEIIYLSKNIKSKDRIDLENMVHILTKQLQSAEQSTESRIFERLLTETINNPDKLDEMIEIIDRYSTRKKFN